MIYFIQDQGTLFIKIGFSAEPAERRLAALQTGNPSGLVLLLTLPGERAAESHLHQRFAFARERGEWFRPMPDILAFMLDAARGSLLLPPDEPALSTAEIGRQRLILDALDRAGPEGLTSGAIHRLCGGHLGAELLRKTMMVMIADGLVRKSRHRTTGRPRTMWHLIPAES